MAENNDGEGFFRKMVRFVANPATDWADLGTRQDDSRDLDLEKSELKAMIERKRRNDFVRKREFDMLRKVRREGLSPEQLASLGGSSRLDDSEARMSDNAGDKPDGGVKAKIDEIEQQMVGGTFSPSGRRNSGFFNAPTEPAVLARSGLPPPSGGVPLAAASPTPCPPCRPCPTWTSATRLRQRPPRPSARPGCRRWRRCRWPAPVTPASSSTVSASRSARWCTTRTSTSR